ncbi:MAG: hypothetical protein IKN29_08495 [Bacteroidales bacterium]|nr:hypothetical protein [Bacteroidales bacterium]
MKKVFTLISVALCALTAQAQDVYESVVGGSLAPEFAAVAGAAGGVANNAADGKSIITFTKGKATVTAVGGTTPANDPDKGSGAQQITIGNPVEGKENVYEIASVKAWNDIKWEVKNQGDIDFWYVAGTGNPYVGIYAKQNSKDGDLLPDNYSADYVYYEPDGSAGMPITGLYYKFTATAKGAFKVKVWANKGNRKTFVVDAKTMKAQPLYASGHINGVNENGQKKLLSVAQVDSVHHVYIYGDYEKAVADGGKTEEELAQMKADADAKAIECAYVIGNGNQNFWGWLTFDVEPGEEYWVFQHSSQIGFGGFEFYEGGSAAELIGDIEAPYAFTTNFSTYEDPETGETVTWKGEKIVGAGQFKTDETEGAPFGYYFQNVPGTAPRQNYLLLPSDVLAHSEKTQALSIAVWVNADEAGESSAYMWAPLFTAYGAAPAPYNGEEQYRPRDNQQNTWPMLACQYRGVLQVNNAGWSDFTDAQNVKGANTLYHGDTDWLADKKWHYYTAVFEGDNAKVYFDGELKNEWNNDGTTNTQKGLYTNGADLKYICLGGNQAWAWDDLDPGFKFAKLLIKNNAMSANEIKTQMLLDYPNWAQDNPEGIADIKANGRFADGIIFNIAGQRVGKDFKGLAIKGGKKVFMK